MILLQNVSKKYKNSFFENVNIFVESHQNYTIISNISENCNILLKIISGMFCVDSGVHKLDETPIDGINENFFFIPKNPNFQFTAVQDIIDYFKLYYSEFDIYSFGESLNSIGVSSFDKLSNFSFSEIKLLYLILAINSKASYIFIEDVFDNVNYDIVNIMINLIQKQRNKKSFIFTSTNVDMLKGLVDNIIYNVDSNVGIKKIDYFKEFFKCSGSFKTRYKEDKFKIYNPLYLKIYQRSIVIIFKRDSNVVKFIDEENLIQYDELDFNLSDILYCLGDSL